MSNRADVDAAWAEVLQSTISGVEWNNRVKNGYKGKPYNWQNTAFGRAKLLLDKVADCGVVPPPNVFGTALPARLPASPGPVVTVTTTADLLNKIASAPLGSVIDGGGRAFDLAGQTVLWNRAGSAAAVTELRNATLVGGGINSALRCAGSGSYFRATNVETANSEVGVKFTDASHHVEFSGSIHDCVSQGVLVTGSGTFRQLWNTRLARNGHDANYDHNVYWGYSFQGDVIANCAGDAPWAYNLQAYPSVKNLLVTMCDWTGGQAQPDARGGIVLGSEGTLTTYDNVLVGQRIVGAPSVAFHINGPSARNTMYDSCEFNNAQGGFIPETPGIVYVNCVHANTVLVDAARYPLVPPFDIDGNPRPAQPRAGAFA